MRALLAASIVEFCGRVGFVCRVSDYSQNRSQRARIRVGIEVRGAGGSIGVLGFVAMHLG